MSEQRKSEYREYSYEWLRIISCISVVIIHVSGIYLRPEFFSIVGYKNYIHASWWRVITCMCVPSFIMISGAFNLKKENADAKIFYKKKAKRIVMPTLIFSILYVLIHYMEIAVAYFMNVNVADEKMDLVSPLIYWLKGQPNTTMWYMYMIIPLYFITPLIVIIKQKIPLLWWRILGILMLVVGYIIGKNCTLIWPIEFTEYLGYFMAGDIIRELSITWKEKKEKYVRYIGALCIALSYFGLIMYWYHTTYKAGVLELPQYLSFIVITMALLQFVGFSFLKIDKIFKCAALVSKYSLDIYLLHPMFLIVATQYFCRIKGRIPVAYGIPVYSCVVIGLCMVTLMLFQKMTNRIKEWGGQEKC